MVHSSYVFDRGYAVPVYEPSPSIRRWRFRSEEITTPATVPAARFAGWDAAPIDLVRAHAL
jgi:hypothetical protein